MPDPSEMVKVGVSPGETCFLCEERIEKGSRCVYVSFNVVMLVNLGKKTEAAHPPCAIRMADTVRENAEQAMESFEKEIE
ncbi:MAG: hypothetical protein ACREH5_01725 [Candidatus Omnitrophota bacterium]